MPISSALGAGALLPAGLGFRNLLVNGGFDIWQRGTSFTPSANTSVYTADRFGIFRSVSGNHTSTRVSSDLDGFTYFNRLGRASGDTATSPLYAGASLETSTMVVPLQGKQGVFSFYARKGSGYSATNSQITLYFEYGSGTDTAFLTGLTNQVSQTFTLTTSWQRFYFTLPTLPSGTTAARYFFAYTPTGTANSTDYWDLTGMQLEANYQATPFERRPVGTELILCQRYYEKSYDLATAPGTSTTNGSVYTSQTSDTYGNIGCYLFFKTRKRVTPTITFYYGATAGSWIYNKSGTGDTLTAMNWTNLWKGEAGGLIFGGIGTAWTAGTLQGHWVAEAEL